MNLYISNSKKEFLRFFRNFTYFISVLLVLNLIFFFTLKQISQYINYFKITPPSNKVKIIILSDSRGNVIKDKMLPDSVANLSYGSDSYNDLLSKMSYAVKNFPNLNTLLLTVDEHCFLSYRAKYNNSDKSILFADYNSYKNVNTTNRVNFEISKFVAKWLPITSKKNMILVSKYYESKLLGKRNNISTNNDSDWCSKTFTVRNKLELERFNFQFNTIYDPSMASTFISICNLANKYNIKVIGIKFPITVGYRKHLKSKSFTEIKKVISSSGIVVIDYTNDVYNECYFENQDHLNSRGAEILTKKLLSEHKLKL